MPEIEFTASQGGGFEPLPAASYNFRVAKVDMKTTKTTNNPMMQVSLVVLDGPYEGKKVSLFLVITAKSGFRIQQLLEAAIPGEYETFETNEKDDQDRPINAFKFNTDALIDTTFTADLTVGKDDKGEPRNEFKKMYRYGESSSSVSEIPADGQGSTADGQGATEAPATAEAAPAAESTPAPTTRRRIQQTS
jgi:hypothetical protein